MDADRGTFTVLRMTQAVGVRLLDIKYSAGFVFPSQRYKDHVLSLVLSGRLVERCGGAENTYRPGHVRFLPARTFYSGECNAATRILHLGFSEEFLSRHGLGDVTDLQYGELGTPRIQHLLRRLQSELSRDEAISPVAIEGLTLQVVAEVCREGRPTQRLPHWLVQARVIMEKNPYSDLRAIASQVGVHPVHLCRAFHAHYQVSTRAFRALLRRQKAAEAQVGAG